MNQINQNINNKYGLFQAQPAFKSEQTQQLAAPEVQIPDMYYVPNDRFEQKSFKETVKEADIMGLVYPWLEHPLLMLGTCAGLAYGVDKFSEACGGDYEKSLIGKAAKLGDRIQNSDAVKSKPVQTVIDLGKSGKKKFYHIFRNSDVINAIKTTPSMPEWGIVKDEMLGQEQRIVHQFTTITSGLNLGNSEPIKLKNLGLTSDEKEMIKGISNNEKAANTVILKRLGRSQSEINKIVNMTEGSTSAVKEEILKEMGLTANELDAIKKDSTGKYILKVKNAAEKVKGKVWIGAGEFWPGPIQPFKRRIGCDEVYNRLHSVSEGAQTATGKFMSKFLQKLHRGFTFGGGKLGVLAFVSPLLVETMIDTKKADKDQKIGTAAHGIVEAVSWVFTFPLALWIMHSLCGAQYAGMGKEKVEQYRKLLNEFNTKVKGGNLSKKAEYDSALKTLKEELKSLEKVEGQNLLTKLCRKLGKAVTVDLEKPLSYRGSNIGANTARKLPSFFRNLGGIPMRLGIWGVLSMGVLGGAITKGTKALFGNYYDRYKEEEHEAAKKKQKQFLKDDLQARLLETQKKKVEAAQSAQISPIQQQPNEITKPEISEKVNIIPPKEATIPNTIPEETVKAEAESKIQEPQNIQVIQPETEANTKLKQNPEETLKPKAIEVQHPDIPVTNNNMKVKRDNYTYIPSQDNVLNNKDKSQSGNKYIPSQNGANIVKNFDNSGLQGALNRADRAEQRAIEVLSGQFRRSA